LFSWYGAYFGVTLAMLLYNAFVLLIVRTISYLYYVLYVAATMLLQFTLQGFGFEYLWPWSTTLNNTMVVLLTGLMPLCAVAFVVSFIGLGTIGTRIERLIAQALYAGFGVALISVFTLSYHTTLTIEHALAIVSMLMGFFLGIKYASKGFKSARIFSAAWLIYLIFVGYYLADITGAMQPDAVSRHGLEIGSLTELVLLSLAFADRLNSEKELRLAAQKAALDAQRQLNRDLDDLVHARTAQLRDANDKLVEISTTDGLTGLHNRRYFNEIFDREYRRAFREQRHVTVLMIDVDHFKSINDSYGHQAGDRCLTQVAEIIRTSVRRPPDLPARYGGEEFIALLPETPLAGACHVAEAIRQTIANCKITYNDLQLQVTVSIGVAAEVPVAAEHGEALIKRADEQLYLAKAQGRNRIQAAGAAPDRVNAEAVNLTRAQPSSTQDSAASSTAGRDGRPDIGEYAVLI